RRRESGRRHRRPRCTTARILRRNTGPDLRQFSRVGSRVPRPEHAAGAHAHACPRARDEHRAIRRLVDGRHREALEALHRLFAGGAGRGQQQGRRDIHFYWIGQFDPDEADVEHGTWAAALAARRASNLTFLGVQPDARPYLRAGDVFVVPSREDPFPLVALEAAQYGLPVACFAGSGGTPELVEEDAGAVVPAGDVDAMADRIVAMLDDGTRRRALGARAREKILSRFTTARTAPQILAACRRGADKQPARPVDVPN